MVVRLVLMFIASGALACSGSTATSQQQTLPATKAGAICDKFCGTSRPADVCETKFSAYSDAALDAYDLCKGESSCITSELAKKDPGVDAKAFASWTCTTCSLKSTAKFCTDFAPTVSAYGIAILNQNRVNCESPLRKVAAKHPNATTTEEIVSLENECAIEAYACFRVTAYPGKLCEAQ